MINTSAQVWQNHTMLKMQQQQQQQITLHQLMPRVSAQLANILQLLNVNLASKLFKLNFMMLNQ